MKRVIIGLIMLLISHTVLGQTSTSEPDSQSIAVYVLVDVSDSVCRDTVLAHIDNAAKVVTFVALRRGDYFLGAVFGTYGHVVDSATVKDEGHVTDLYEQFKEEVEGILDDREEKKTYGALPDLTLLKIAYYTAIVEGFLPQYEISTLSKHVLIVISDGKSDYGGDSVWQELSPSAEFERIALELPGETIWLYVAIGFRAKRLSDSSVVKVASIVRTLLDDTDRGKIKKAIEEFRSAEKESLVSVLLIEPTDITEGDSGIVIDPTVIHKPRMLSIWVEPPAFLSFLVTVLHLLFHIRSSRRIEKLLKEVISGPK